MRRVIATLLLLSVCLSATSQEARRTTRGSSAGYATRNATVLSMMGWGFLLAGGIATLCILLENDEGHAHSH